MTTAALAATAAVTAVVAMASASAAAASSSQHLISQLDKSATSVSRHLPVSTQQLLQASNNAERIAYQILHSHKQMIVLDAQRQSYTEALASFRQKKALITSVNSRATAPKSDAVYTLAGPLFIKMQPEEAQQMLLHDQQQLSVRIDALRAEIKLQMQQLQEYRPSELNNDVVNMAMSTQKPVESEHGNKRAVAGAPKFAADGSYAFNRGNTTITSVDA